MKKQLLLPIALSLIALPFLQHNDAQTDSLQITIQVSKFLLVLFLKTRNPLRGGG